MIHGVFTAVCKYIWCELITICITHIQARKTHVEVKDKSINDSLIYFWCEYFHFWLVFIILYKQVGGVNEVKAEFCNLEVVEIISIIYAISNLTVGKLFNLSYWRLFFVITHYAFMLHDAINKYYYIRSHLIVTFQYPYCVISYYFNTMQIHY